MCEEKHVTLVLATKTIPQEVLKRLHDDYPAIIMGENRQQELCEKYFEGAHWIFIGRLQRNKVKYLVDKVQMICSVDSRELAAEIERQAVKHDKVMPVLIEVNCGEVEKGGVPMGDLPAMIEACRSMPHLEVQGIMAVLPIEGAKEAAQRVGALYDQIKDRYNLRYLSMGMTNDYHLAIEYGANMIRIGSAIFGKRS